MFSLLLPPDCLDASPTARERRSEWRRRVHAPTLTSRGPVTGVLRVRAVSLRRLAVTDPVSRWSLL